MKTRTILMLKQQWLLGMLLLLAGACHKTVDPDYPDERGVQLADLSSTTPSVSFSQLLDWSADGSDLYYLTLISGHYQLRAINVQSKVVRQLAQDVYVPYNSSLAQGPDGQYLYVLIQPVAGQTRSPYYLCQIDTRQSKTVVIDSSNEQRYQYTPSVILSPDGSRRCFQYRYDSARVYNLGTHSSVRLLAYRPVAFSPDASHVLLTQENATHRNVSLTDFTFTAVDPSVQPVDQTFPILSRSNIYWHTGGVLYVYDRFYKESANSFPIGLFLWNISQVKNTLLWPLPNEERGLNFSKMSWSRSGQRIAFFTSNFGQAFSGSPNYQLYTTDLTTLKTTKVATVTQQADEKSQNVDRLLISPDQSQLAYAMGKKLYVVPVQP